MPTTTSAVVKVALSLLPLLKVIHPEGPAMDQITLLWRNGTNSAALYSFSYVEKLKQVNTAHPVDSLMWLSQLLRRLKRVRFRMT